METPARGGRRIKKVEYFPILLSVLLLAACFLLMGCHQSEKLTSEDYAKADAALQQVSQTTYAPRAKEDGTPFRVAYVDIDPYPPSGEMFYYFVKQLMERGWINTGEELPFSPLDTDAKELIRYISENDQLDYLQFDHDITYYLAVDGEEECRKLLEEEIANNTVDLIFCMGTWPGKFVKDMGIQDVPVMVYFSVDPEGAGISEAAQFSGQDNIWCHVNYTVYNKQLEFYHGNFKFHKMGIVYYDESVSAMRAYRKVAETRGFSIVEEQINKLEDAGTETEDNYYMKLKAACEKLIEEGQIDAFLLGTDLIKDESRMPEILDLFYQNKIPVFVQNGEYFVQQGALMLVTASDARDQAPFIADTFAAILHGAKPGELRQVYLSPPYLAINLDAADELGYDLPNELIFSAKKFYRKGGEE